MAIVEDLQPGNIVTKTSTPDVTRVLDPLEEVKSFTFKLVA